MTDDDAPTGAGAEDHPAARRLMGLLFRWHEEAGETPAGLQIVAPKEEVHSAHFESLLALLRTFGWEACVEAFLGYFEHRARARRDKDLAWEDNDDVLTPIAEPLFEPDEGPSQSVMIERNWESYQETGRTSLEAQGIRWRHSRGQTSSRAEATLDDVHVMGSREDPREIHVARLPNPKIPYVGERDERSPEPSTSKIEGWNAICEELQKLRVTKPNGDPIGVRTAQRLMQKANIEMGQYHEKGHVRLPRAVLLEAVQASKA